MYKVFWNDREIVVAAPIETGFGSKEKPLNFSSSDELKTWFLDFTKTEIKKALILNLDPENYFHSVFISAFKMIEAAGGVVIRDDKLLFIFRNGKWDLPKGKIDPGETSEQAALREVTEECGISGHTIVRQLPATYHIYQSPYKNEFGTWILKQTFWYEMNYSGIENGIPETAENITEIRWFAKSELCEVLENTYDNLKDLIEVYLPPW